MDSYRPFGTTFASVYEPLFPGLATEEEPPLPTPWFTDAAGEVSLEEER